MQPIQKPALSDVSNFSPKIGGPARPFPRMVYANNVSLNGYARVSTGRQSVAAQVATLTQPGAERAFKETASGAKTDPAQIQKLLNALDEGDVLLLTRVDRLARAASATCSVRSPSFRRRRPVSARSRHTWADTTTAHGRADAYGFMRTCGVRERTDTARTSEGRARAKARGVKLGRKFKLTPHQQREADTRRDKGEPLMDSARTYNLSHSTIPRLSA